MEIGDPVLGAQIFEIDPHGAARAAGHRREIRAGQLARERLDHDIGDLERVAHFRMPVFDHDAVDRLPARVGVDSRQQPRERVQVVDEEAHLPAVFVRELAGEAPAHADVAEVVDHGAEEVACDRIVGRERYSGSGGGAGHRSGPVNALNWRF
ncbi:hypothetical protein BamMEX5DRAFT_1539 [Burkholderia ambifaria MEX-5]|uniref:Uncharacterized protein n=1 Tax=Burkholderia ambifaria MEX-5 TaxID=396597 RepID=B1T173_9BURK|nr:hypothetical protein BamMEX5DRAFT_1539 [Burkholderia ambifaria MEX-5]